MPVDQHDPAETGAIDALEQILDHGDIGAHAQRDRAGEGDEARRHAIGEHGKDGDVERLGGVRRDLLCQDRVGGETEVSMLLDAAEWQHAAVVMLDMRLDLHPVHLRDQHRPAPCKAHPAQRRSAQIRQFRHP